MGHSPASVVFTVRHTHPLPGTSLSSDSRSKVVSTYQDDVNVCFRMRGRMYCGGRTGKGGQVRRSVPYFGREKIGTLLRGDNQELYRWFPMNGHVPPRITMAPAPSREPSRCAHSTPCQNYPFSIQKFDGPIFGSSTLQCEEGCPGQRPG